MSNLGLGRRPFFLDEAAHARLIDQLRGKEVVFLDIDGRSIVSEDDLLVLLGQVYDFPDYYGENWDAFLDCYANVVEMDERPIVLTIRGLVNFRDTDFRSFFRAIYELESITETISIVRPVIPRRVVNVYPGTW